MVEAIILNLVTPFEANVGTGPRLCIVATCVSPWVGRPNFKLDFDLLIQVSAVTWIWNDSKSRTQSNEA